MDFTPLRENVVEPAVRGRSIDAQPRRLLYRGIRVGVAAKGENLPFAGIRRLAGEMTLQGFARNKIQINELIESRRSVFDVVHHLDANAKATLVDLAKHVDVFTDAEREDGIEARGST